MLPAAYCLSWIVNTFEDKDKSSFLNREGIYYHIILIIHDL